MYWERAKTIVLISLVLLNVGLGGMLFAENRRYSLVAEQERLIRTVLNQNGIIVYDLPLNRFPPMRPLDVTGFYYDADALLSIFFPEEADIVVTRQFGGEVFQYGDRRMSITNGFIFFDDPKGFCHCNEVEYVTEEWAVSIADIFIAEYFPDFYQDGVFVFEDTVRVVYRQKYAGRFVHSNFIEFLVSTIGINQIEMQFGEIIGHTGTPVMIFAPDEALLTFVQRVRHMAQDEPMTIQSMDLVYFQEYVSNQDYVYTAVPFYRIFTACGDGRPFLINAFTNVIID